MLDGREAEDDAVHGHEQEAEGGGRGEEAQEEEVASGACGGWPPRRGRPRLHVAVPGSVLSVEPSLREKTLKAGLIARALAVYRVDEVVVYEDPDTGQGDVSLLAGLLRYAVTPPHLRRRLYPLKPWLRYAGLLPPLQVPPHLAPAEPVPGSLIDGVVEAVEGGVCRVWLGSLGTAVARGCRGARRGSVVTVRIEGVRGGALAAVAASWGEIYAGYRVRRAGGLAGLLRRARERGYTILGTSRYGDCSPTALAALARGGRPLLVVFGGPRRGILNYTSREMYDAVVNTVPGQGTKTVRTEEALHATLALINLYRA